MTFSDSLICQINWLKIYHWFGIQSFGSYLRLHSSGYDADYNRYFMNYKNLRQGHLNCNFDDK